MSYTVCECGGRYTRSNSSHHKKSRVHKNYINKKLSFDDVYNAIMKFTNEEKNELYRRLKICKEQPAEKNIIKKDEKKIIKEEHPLHKMIKRINDEIGEDAFKNHNNF